MTTDSPVPNKQASIWIDASPDVVWNHVADIATLPHHSPETTRTEWLPGSDRHEVGAAFRGYNSNGNYEWHADCAITEFAELEVFAFSVTPDDDGNYSTLWRYTLEPENNGTRLTESFESPLLQNPPPGMSPTRFDTLVDMLNATLASIKAEIEAN